MTARMLQEGSVSSTRTSNREAGNSAGKKMRQEKQRPEREQETGNTALLAFKMEGGALAEDQGNLEKLERGRKWGVLQASRRNAALLMPWLQDF